MPSKGLLDQGKSEAILKAMERAGCVRADAARLLGRSEAWLYAEISRLGLAKQIRTLETAAGRETWAPGRPKRRARRRQAA